MAIEIKYTSLCSLRKEIKKELTGSDLNHRSNMNNAPNSNLVFKSKFGVRGGVIKYNFQISCIIKTNN